MSTQTTTTAWPAGVIARYLTVGGATVDVTHDALTVDDPQPNLSHAKCGGCSAYSNADWASRADRWDNGSAWAGSDARAWAQKHAETCRAMPKPTA